MTRSSLPPVPWGISQALVVYIAAWVGLPFVMVVTLAQLSPYSVVAQRFLDRLASQSDIEASFVLTTLVALGSLALVLGYIKRYGVGLDMLGLRRFNWLKAAGLIVGGFIVFAVGLALVIELVSWLFPAFDPDQAQVNEFTNPTTRQALRLSLVALVILPAILEEIVFRGFMFPAFAKRLGWLGGAFLTSLLFGLAHLQLNIIVYTLVLGLVLCMLYRSTGSIWPGIALHMLNNYLAFTQIVPQ